MADFLPVVQPASLTSEAIEEARSKSVRMLAVAAPIGVGIEAGLAAAGAHIASRSPSLGAGVAAGALPMIVTGGLMLGGQYDAAPEGTKTKALVVGAISSVVVGSGAAIGAKVAKRRKKTGAAIGAAIADLLVFGYAYYAMQKQFEALAAPPPAAP